MLRLNIYIAHLDITMFIWNVTPITSNLSRQSTPDILGKTSCIRDGVTISITEKCLKVSMTNRSFYCPKILFHAGRIDFH